MKKIALFTLTLLTTIFVQSANNKSTNLSQHSKTFVLVHGAWQASYAWDFVKADLVKKGYTVIVVELPGHGSDATPAVKASINAYRDEVVTAIKGSKEKVVLVGHSMGGLVISAVAEIIPDKIEKLVYLGAFLPTNGDSLMSLTMQDRQSLLGPAIVPSTDQLMLDVKKESLFTVFCQDASDKIKKLVLDNYRSEPAIPFGDKIALSDSNFGTVKKYYIHTSLDNAVGIDLQNKMVTASNVSKEYTIESGHLPHLTKPHQLSKILMEIIK